MSNVPCLIQSHDGLCNVATLLMERDQSAFLVYNAAGYPIPYRMTVSGETVTAGWGDRSGQCAILSSDDAAWQVLVRQDELAKLA